MIYRNFLKSLLLIAVSALLSLSCDDGVRPGPVYSPEYAVPVVSGITITGYESPDPFGTWGNPAYNHKGKVSFMNTPYPNPSNIAVALQFGLYKAANVKIWAVKAKIPADLPIEGAGVFNTVLVSLPPKIIILPEENLQAGYFRNEWNYSEKSERLPAGFYRIYIKADDDLLWDDILIAYQNSDYPSDLQGK